VQINMLQAATRLKAYHERIEYFPAASVSAAICVDESKPFSTATVEL
jgi:hypothetical protein